MIDQSRPAPVPISSIGTGENAPCDRFALSSYLAFRYVTDPEVSWRPGVRPSFPVRSVGGLLPVRTSLDITKHLTALMSEASAKGPIGILLSGGIDSAILATFMPRGSPAYTIHFSAEGAVDETPRARLYAERSGLEHREIVVRWEDYEACVDQLMVKKKAPLHAAEVGLYLAARRAFEDGVDSLVLGNGADSNFGGLDKLLSRDWTFDDFVRRYSFVMPGQALREPADINRIYEPFRRGEQIDYLGFLGHVHGLGIIQAFDNAIGAGGCKSVEPYERLYLDVPLDLSRIRGGDSKYLLRPLFAALYAGLDLPEKIAFARPMDRWLADWEGPVRDEFLPDLDMSVFSGDQKWLLYCLERFLNLLDASGGAISEG